jgi:hypothetical protein
MVAATLLTAGSDSGDAKAALEPVGRAVGFLTRRRLDGAAALVSYGHARVLRFWGKMGLSLNKRQFL